MTTADYSQTCSCGHRIEEGDLVGKVDGEWVCESCVEDNGGEDPPRSRRARHARPRR